MIADRWYNLQMWFGLLTKVVTTLIKTTDHLELLLISSGVIGFQWQTRAFQAGMVALNNQATDILH